MNGLPFPSLGIFLTRDPTHVSCIGRQILYYYATWEAPTTSCAVVELADEDRYARNQTKPSSLGSYTEGPFSCLKLLWGYQRYTVYFHPMCSLPRGRGHLKSKPLTLLNRISLGDSASIILEHGSLPRPGGPLLISPWTRSDSLGQIWNRFLKANVGVSVTETCQMVCQECLVPSP